LYILFLFVINRLLITRFCRVQKIVLFETNQKNNRIHTDN